MIGLLPLPLWGHVSSSVHSHECESSIVFLNIASNLLSVHVCDVVRAPLIDDGPAKVSDPTLSSIGGHGTIGISGVLQDLIFALELYIDPLRSIL